MRRPRLKRTRETVLTAAGDIYVLRPGEDADLVIEQPDAATRGLLGALDGRRSRAELEQEFGAERVGDALRQLSELGLLDDAADDERLSARERARYDRQLRYFSDLSVGALPPSEHQRRLREARVLILGVGGLGSWASYALACCGVGELVLLDGDRRRGEQLQPPDPLPRARHRPPEGRGRSGRPRRVQLELPARRRWRAGWRARTPCASWPRRPTSW